jgi:hypothetical protein
VRRAGEDELIIKSEEPFYSKWDQIRVVLKLGKRITKGEIDDVIRNATRYYTEWYGSAKERIVLLVASDLVDEAKMQRAAEKASHGLNIVLVDEASMRSAAGAKHEARRKLRRIFQTYTSLYDQYSLEIPINSQSDFYGRAPIIDQIQDLVRRGSPFGITGMWRVGKTSLLNQLLFALGGHLAVRVDLLDYANSDIQSLTSDVLRGLSGNGKEKFPGLSLPITTLQSDRGADPVANFASDLLTFGNALRERASHSQIIVILDEIDTIFQPKEDRIDFRDDIYRRLIGRLLSLNSREKIVIPVFCGRAAQSVHLLAENSELRVPNSLPLVHLKPMQRHECDAMVTGIGSLMAVGWSLDSLAKIFIESGGHPHIARFLCGRVFGMFGTNGGLDYNEAQVRAARDSYVQDPNNYFNRIWQQQHFNVQEKELLRVLARRMVWSESDAIKQLESQAEYQAFQVLENYGIIRRQSSDVAVVGDMFRDWIVQKKQIMEVGT